MSKRFFASFACAMAPFSAAVAETPPASPAPANEIDFVAAAPDVARILLENDEVRVIEYNLAPGAKDNWHTHPAKVSYVVAGGDMRIHLADGTSFDVTEKDGDAAWSEALGKHYVENIGKTPIRIVLVEVKAAQ